jgi:hypothetical protein
MAKRRKDSKQFIIHEAFKLFCKKPYDKVTFSDIEAATGLSRGAILYHFPNKETIFRNTIDLYIFNKHTIIENVTNIDGTLLIFINSYVDWIGATKKTMKELGIKNMNQAFANITMQAMYFYPDFVKKASEWEKQEVDTWVKILQKAVNNKEIKGDIDTTFIAKLFKNVFYGTSYAGLVIPNGVNISMMKQSYLHIYSSIKK